MKTLLHGGKIVTEEGILKRDLIIEGEKIKKVVKPGELAGKHENYNAIDVTGRLIMPGIIDAHTHYQLRSRSTVTADDFYSGSAAAACGGVTTFIDFADQSTDLTLPETTESRLEEAAGEAVVDFTLHQSVYNFNERIAKELAEIKEMGISSIKIFTTYRREGYLIEPDKWEALFVRLKEVQLLPVVHAEDNDLIERLEEEYKRRGKTSPAMHPRIRPAESEGIAVRNVGNLAHKVGLPVYIAHLSSGDGYRTVKEIRQSGGRIFAETTPHYLLLDDSYLQREEPQLYIMTPPLRKEKDQKELWAGLESGLIQAVATDHCAFNREQKLSSDSCLSILPGLPGSETLLPLIHHFGVNRGNLDYPDLVRILAAEPARIFGIYPRKGSLEEGTDADLTIFDTGREIRLTGDNLHSRAGYSPYREFTVTGYPVMTFLRGQKIMDNGEFIGKRGEGRIIKGGTSSLFRQG